MSTEKKERKPRTPKHVGCSIENCEGKHYAKTYCRTHWTKYNLYGDPEYRREFVNSGKTCIEDDCDRPAFTRQRCQSHYQMWWHRNAVPRPVDEQHWAYTDNPSYEAIHYRVWRARGKAKTYACVDCGKTAHDWSLRHDAPGAFKVESAKNPRYVGSLVSLDPYDYEPRCTYCHRAYDAQHGNRKYKTGEYAQVSGDVQ